MTAKERAIMDLFDQRTPLPQIALATGFSLRSVESIVRRLAHSNVDLRDRKRIARGSQRLLAAIERERKPA